MARYVYVVFSDSKPGMEDEYHRWYNDRHLADQLKVREFISAERFEHVDADNTTEPPQRYLAIYEVEADDLDAAQAEVIRLARETDEMPVTPALDFENSHRFFFASITEKLTK